MTIYQGVPCKVGDVVWVQARVVSRDPQSTIAVLAVGGLAALTDPEGTMHVRQVDPIQIPCFLEDIYSEHTADLSRETFRDVRI